MARAKLGQHFLDNKTALKLIIESLRIASADTIIEIGPGHGELTEPLLKAVQEKRGRLICIERDPTLFKKLENAFRANTRCSLVLGDALELLPRLVDLLERQKKSYKVVGNIPYYITGNLLRILGELQHKPERIVLTLQHEVAERITATPPRMNLLAAAIQFWADARIVGRLSRRDFKPMPQVDSAVIACIPRPLNPALRFPAYYKLIRAVFKQPRKTLTNNLASAFPNKSREEVAALIAAAGLEPLIRPQNLTVGDLKKLSKIVYNKSK